MSNKLLLLALSGVRIKDQELLQYGMTLPGFVERGRVIASLPSLSLLTIASYTPASWEIVYQDLDQIDSFDLAAILRAGYTLVAISALTARIWDAYRISDSLRAEGVAVVLGGLHVTALPQEALQHASSVVIGEAEPVWPKLIEDFEQGQLQATYSSLSHHPRFSFNDCKVPRFDLLDVTRYNRITLQTSRGCPLACNFCAASRLISKYKTKPLESIRRELEAIVAIWPDPFIELADDNTFYNKRAGGHIPKLLKEFNLRWFTETDISIADHDEILEAAAESGCAQLLIGLESAVPESLRGVDANDWKYRQYESYLKKIDNIQAHGISVNGCFILGFDTDDQSVFQTTADFVKASSLAEVQITLLTPFPGTELLAKLRQEGRLFADVFWDSCTLFDLTFHPKQMSADELGDGFKWLMSQLYNDDERLRRRAIFRECIRNGRSNFKR